MAEVFKNIFFLIKIMVEFMALPEEEFYERHFQIIMQLL